MLINLPKPKVHHSSEKGLNFCYLKIILILHPCYHPKIIGHILKNKQKNKRVYIHEIIQLIIMKMKMKMKNRSHRYDINRPRSRHGGKYSKYKRGICMMMLICIKQHLSTIWSSICEKLSNTEAELKKRVACKKSVYTSFHLRCVCLTNIYQKYSIECE